MRNRRPTASLFARLLSLTGLTLFAAWAVSVLLIFNLPPPVPDFYRIDEIRRAYAGEEQSFGERRPLAMSTRSRMPSPPLEGRQIPAIQHRLAESLGIPTTDVVIAGDRGPLTDRRVGQCPEHLARPDADFLNSIHGREVTQSHRALPAGRAPLPGHRLACTGLGILCPEASDSGHFRG